MKNFLTNLFRVVLIVSLVAGSSVFAANPAFVNSTPGLFTTNPVTGEAVPVYSTTGFPVTQGAATTASASYLQVTTVSKAITAFTGRTNLSIVVNESGKEVWVSIGTTTAIVDSTSNSFVVRSSFGASSFGDSIPVGIIASENVKVSVIQY